MYTYSNQDILMSNKYKVLDGYKHVIERKDMHLGANENGEEKMYLYDYSKDVLKFEKVMLNFGFLKIFDEIIVNAIDNLSRSTSSCKLTTIKVNIENVDVARIIPPGSRAGGVNIENVDVEGKSFKMISVYNDGPSIPIEKYVSEDKRFDETEVQYKRRMEEESKIIGKYYPEVLFTILRSSGNYNDDEERTTGGLNGLGAKLTNIFSILFIVEVENNGKYFKQIIRNNCENIGKPEIKKCEKNKSSVKISFIPDWEKLDKSKRFTDLNSDMEMIIAKRLFDYSHLGLDLYFNDFKYPNLSFIEFSHRHLSINNEIKVYENICMGKFNKWKLCLGFTDKKNMIVSYVNNIVTYENGDHVKLIQKQILSMVNDELKLKIPLKGTNLNPRISIVLYSEIPGARFTSQAKTSLSMSKIEVPEINPRLIKDFVEYNHLKEFFTSGKVKSQNNKTVRTRITDIKKLKDAEEAGIPIARRSIKNHICTLFICEGDSAQTLCDRGIKILGEQFYGSFALRGKVLNVLKANKDQYNKNIELTSLKKAIGLVDEREYTDLNSLRYQRIICCKDADHDGSAIMGLVINFFYRYFRTLMERNDYFFEFITPVVNVYDKKYEPKSSKILRPFYNLNLFNKAVENGEIDEKRFYCKYIKGLGGNTDKDIETYFGNFDKHVIHIDCSTDATEECIKLAYSDEKGYTDKRKEWVSSVNNDSYLARDNPTISFDDFTKIDLALAGFDQCERSIPSVIDGFKPSQRKVMYTFFNMNQKQAKTSTKVFQLTGKVSDFASYHHGDSSMNGTIIKMAQDFVGSNNIPFLERDGQFGSRNKLGEDASAPRYIAAYLSDISRLIFPQIDDVLLTRKMEDNELVEPKFYIPIIPSILMNGIVGIGNGWSTTIPAFNPVELIDETEKAIKNFNPKSPSFSSLTILPWYRNWKGRVVEYIDQWEFVGNVNKISENVYEVTEIPIDMSIDKLRERMNELISEKILENYIDLDSRKKNKKNISLDTIDFQLIFTPGKVKSVNDVISLLKLSSSISKNNLVAFDQNEKIVKYEKITNIFAIWFMTRYNCYIRRKKFIKDSLEKDLKILNNKYRFVKKSVDEPGTYFDGKKTKDIVSNQLEIEKYDKIDDSFEYLLKLPMYSMTSDNLSKLAREIENLKIEIDKLSKTSVKIIWINELEILRKYILENY